MNDNKLQISNKAMEYIVALEKHRTISAAAEAVYISQPAMSHFVHALEKRLGFCLFNRVGNRYVPTYEGERYLAYAKRIMAIETQMCNEFSDIRKKNRGWIRFVLPTQRSAYILPRLINDYCTRYPNVELTIQETHSRFLEKVLLDGTVDFAIMNTAIKNTDIVAEVIRHDEVLLAVPPNHPCIGKGKRLPGSKYETIDISLFKSDRFILQKPDQRTRQAADTLLANAGVVPDIMMEIHSIEAALGIVGGGVGVCFAPETYIYQPHFFTQPYYFSVGQPEAVYDISIAYTKNIYRPQYVEDFITAVKDAILWRYPQNPISDDLL